MASGVAAGTAKTRYIHPDHLGSTNVVTDENGGVIETLDYFPYGATRISTGVDASARKYIGQFSDISGLSYFNARYYSSDRGQFISQDPVFLAIGDPNTLKQLTGLDQQSFLSDPQLANSTSYARGNPISNKDPKGLLALKLGGSYTIPGWGLSGSAGVYIDWNGIDYYYGTGLAAGGGASVTGQLTTANLPHVYSISTSVFTGGGYMYGAELSAGTTYYPYSTRPPQPYTEAGLGITPFKLTAGAMAEVSGPIWQWNKSPVINSSLPKPAMVSNVNFPNANTTAPAQNAPGSGGSSAFQRQVQIAALQLQVAQLQLQVIQLQTKARSN